MLLPYQQRWLNDASKLKIMEKSRQIGMSWTAAASLVRRHARDDARLDSWVSSRDETQARLFLDDCKAFARLYDLAARDLGRKVLDESARASTASLAFHNGTRIHSLSSNADAQAGKRGPRILDEFALHPDPRRLYAIAYPGHHPGITWGGSLEIISTHRGSQNFFAHLLREITDGGNPKGFSHHRVTLADALEQGFLDALKAKLPAHDPRQEMDADAYHAHIRSQCPDEESFQQEYCCNPADDATTFLPYDLITPCEYPEGEYESTYRLPMLSALGNPSEGMARNASARSNAPSLDGTARSGIATSGSVRGKAPSLDGTSRSLFLGLDLGRDHDLTVIWLLERTPQQSFLTRGLITLHDTPFSDQEAILYRLLDMPQLRRACIDQTGLGRQFAERARARCGPHRVEPVTFTPAVKEELAYPLRTAFEDRALRIPPDPAIRADLRAIRKLTTASGNIRFAADRGKNGHADRFWALALALHAARTPPYPKTHYESLSRQLHTR